MPSPVDALTGFGTTAESSLATVPSSVMQPVSDYIGDVASGRAALQSLQSLDSGPRYDPSKSLEQNVLAGLPTAQSVVMSAGPGLIGGMRGAAAAEKANLSQVTPRLRDVTEAMDMEAAGRSADNIFATTGWYRGPDKQWKFILSDKNAKLLHGEGQPLQPNMFVPDLLSLSRATQPVTLPQILEHPDLYKIYPWTKDISVEAMPLHQIGYEGIFDPHANTIRLAGRSHDTMLSTLLHEVQHAVQFKEGFGRGGSPEEYLPAGFTEQYDASQAGWRKVRDALKERGIDADRIRSLLREQSYGRPGLKVWEREFSKLTPQDQKDMKTIMETILPMDRQRAEAYNRYRHLAGEVESRDVEHMFREKDWSRMPSQLRGAIPAEKQEVRFGGAGGTTSDQEKSKGMVERGNINLSVRPIVRNPNGSLSTVRSMSFREGGREVLIPTVAADGSRILSDQEAIAQYRRTGQFLGKFDSIRSANQYAKRLHEDQASHPPSPASPRTE